MQSGHSGDPHRPQPPSAAQLSRHLPDLCTDRQVDLPVWVTAASRTAVLTCYADAHARITGLDDTDLTHAAQRFLTWLAESHDRRWIIVLDNLDDSDDLIEWWPPDVAGGHTVVTTRRRDSALLAGRRASSFNPDRQPGSLR